MSDEEIVRVLAAYKAKEEAEERQRIADEQEKKRLEDVEAERQRSIARMEEIIRNTESYDNRLINILL